MHHIILVIHTYVQCDMQYQKTCPTSDKNQILKLTYKSINKTVSVLKAIITNRFLKNSINSLACRLKSLQNMSFYYFLMSRLFFREREKKKGKSSSLYLTDNSKLKNLCKRLRDRHTQRERKNIMSKNTFKIAQESPEKSILLKHEPIHYTRL